MIRTVIKRNGQPAWFAPEKFNRWSEWAAGIGVDWTTVGLEAIKKCHDGCTTDDLTDAQISACVDQETTAHLKMAGRLYMGRLYKDLFGDWRAVPTVKAMYHLMVSKGMWSEMDYSEEELDLCQTFIQHQRDMEAPLTEIKQMMDKYAIVDRVDGKAYETPQFIYMRMALGNMERMPKDRRMNDVFELYNRLSTHKINPPSPFSLNLGTPKRQYASCCTSTTLDTIPSLAASDHIAYVMTTASAGIGSHLKTRSVGDKVRGGAIKHLGKVPYYRVVEALVAANRQANRGGACTMHFNVLDPEFSKLGGLKNVESLPEDRVKDIDYSVGYNNEFARRVAMNEPWMLVSYGDAPALYEAMYAADQSVFLKEYAAVENNVLIPKEVVSARALAIAFLTEAVETGRFYEHNTEEMNRHTPFKDTIYLSNLCQEIGLPVKGFPSVQDLYLEDGEGEIGLCSLAAIAAGLIESDEDHELTAYYAALMIDNVIDLMEYPFPQLGKTAKARRSIGVGITNLAYALAKEGLKYSTKEGKLYIAALAERHSYHLHKAAIRLAEERGICEWASKTKYAEGWLPIDTGNKLALEKIGYKLQYDWESLRVAILKLGGIRFSVLEAHMPCESSSVSGGHTNGLYPVREFKVIKTSGTAKNLFICPDYDELRDKYELAYDVPVEDMIDVYAIVQFFTGQAISADLYIKYGSGERKVSAKELLTQWLYRVRMGLKTRYYMNSSTGIVSEKAEEQEATACESCSL